MKSVPARVICLSVAQCRELLSVRCPLLSADSSTRVRGRCPHVVSVLTRNFPGFVPGVSLQELPHTWLPKFV
ncbi:hypothetical protein HMPREF9582_02106 [Cutibacterium acnes HL060PA1]|nr:hypothetical protein HMPREF9582_02106 [Cutibacterium acnes HL060PA1]